MRILINLTKEEINALGQMKEIRDENDIIFCLHELIERATAKKPEILISDEDTKIGHVTFEKGTKVYKCVSCGGFLSRACKCCPQCGQAVLWEEEN